MIYIDLDIPDFEEPIEIWFNTMTVHAPQYASTTLTPVLAPDGEVMYDKGRYSDYECNLINKYIADNFDEIIKKIN